MERDEEAVLRELYGHPGPDPDLVIRELEPDEVLAAFGRRLRARREALRLSLAQMAARGELSAVAIASYERAERNPTLAAIWEMAAMLECSPADLLPLERREPEELLDAIETATAQLGAAIRRLRLRLGK